MQSDPFSPQFLRSFGITRLGEITGLDTIGIPVWFATRPNSRSLSVSQGKGVTNDQAKISAIMEAVECAVAEQPRQHVTEFATIEDMARQQRSVIPFFDLARVNPHQLDPTRQRAWVPGTSLISGEQRFAPYELVGMDMRSDMPWDRHAFRMTSQGWRRISRSTRPSNTPCSNSWNMTRPVWSILSVCSSTISGRSPTTRARTPI